MNAIRPFSVKLNDGHFMPVLGFGTSAPSKFANSKMEEALKTAINVGYRHIDSAYLYRNEEEIGRAIQNKIANSIVKREDIFYTSKHLSPSRIGPNWPGNITEETSAELCGSFPHSFPSSFEDCSISLKTYRLQTALLKPNTALYFSLPVFQPGEEFFPKDTDGKTIFDTVDICATWEALEKCKEAGLAKSIGVSNFNSKQLQKILSKPGLKYKPVCNQVECHLYLNQSKLLDFCKSKDIVLTAYAALGSDPGKEWVSRNYPVILEDPVLNAIAEKHQRTPAQVALRYQLQRGVVVLAKSFTEKRIRENFQLVCLCLGVEGEDYCLRDMGWIVSHVP
ncbi:aldo-keto reductase family 1 member C1-like isoform 2-T4 [Molossus nigricans]